MLHLLKIHSHTLLLLASMWGTATYDAASTRAVMRAYGPRVQEQNAFQRPFARSKAIYFTLPAQDTASLVLSRLVAKRYPKLERWTDLATAGYFSANHLYRGEKNFGYLQTLKK